MLLYVFIALVLFTFNEYRLIKKYINAIMNPDGKPENNGLYKIIRLVFKPFVLIRNWVNNTLLNDELNYNS